MSHSNLPLHILKNENDGVHHEAIVRCQYDHIVADCRSRTGSLAKETCEANAEMIVHRVNCHDDLLAALKKATFVIESVGILQGNRDLESAVIAARDAIAKAEARA